MDSDRPHHQQPNSTHTHTHNHNHNHKPSSSSDLLASAQVLAEAAKSGANFDRAKVAGAASDLLCAASHYGKLEDKSYGKYVEQAETYLHNYGSSAHHPPPTTTTTAGAHHSATTETHHSGGGGNEHSEGGIGGYMKMAEGFLKKH